MKRKRDNKFITSFLLVKLGRKMKKAIFVTIFIAFVLVNTSYAGIERITKNSIN